MDMVAISSLYPEDTLVYGRCKSTFCAAISCPSDEDRRARKYMSQLLPFFSSNTASWIHGDDGEIFNLHESRLISRLLTGFNLSLVFSLLNVIAFDILVVLQVSETAMKH